MSASSRNIDFIGIGAPRCGTTWISECLREHPQIFFPTQGWKDELAPESLRNTGTKELDFFLSERWETSNHTRGIPWYLSRFPSANEGSIRGEFSPRYLDDPASPGLIHAAFPDVKLIASLRNPVDMIVSLRAMISNFASPNGNKSEDILRNPVFLGVGTYYRNLSRYLEVFPQENLHVILYDDIMDDPAAVIRKVYGFLGVNADFVPAALLKKINGGRRTRFPGLRRAAGLLIPLVRKIGLGFVLDGEIPRKFLARMYYQANTVAGKDDVSPETRRRLKEYYKDDILALEKLLGRSLQAWL